MDVQKENGHSPIAHPILEALSLVDMTGAEMRVVLTVIRQTYGWSRKDAPIAYSEFAALTRLPLATLRRAVAGVVKAGIIIRVRDGGSHSPAVYRIQKNPEKWDRHPFTGSRKGTELMPASEHEDEHKLVPASEHEDEHKLVPASEHEFMLTQTPPLQNKENKENKGADAPSAHEFSEAFESAWRKYPRRDGANPKKSAFKAWTARLNAGASTRDLIVAVENYATHVERDGSAGTRFVMQGSRFFGPDEPFRDFLTAPKPPKQRPHEAWFEPRRAG